MRDRRLPPEIPNLGSCAAEIYRIAEEIELDFKRFEIRIVKIFLDGLYGCGMEDADMEDLVKLVALVDEYGSDKEWDLISDCRP